MTHAAPAPLIGREFDSFLFASIGDDRHGQPLSVLSALARSDVDPWEEAGALARMSRKKAKARLTAMIVALQDEPIAALPLDAIASDLVALLAERERFRNSLAERRPQIGKCAGLVGIERSGRLDRDGSHHLRPSVAGTGYEREFIRVDGERLDETRSAGRPQLAARDANIYVCRGERGHPRRAPCIRRGSQS